MKGPRILLFVLLSAYADVSSAQSGTTAVPDANPARPTVSTPATLTPVGYLQFENGVLFAEESTEFSRRFAASQVTKLSVVDRLELFLQTEPLVLSASEGAEEVHEGEVFAGLQAVLLSGHERRPTVSVSYVRRVHASVAPELDIGTFRQATSILVSDDLHGFHFDANGIFTEQIQRDVHRAQFGQTLSVSHPLGKFTVSGEIWHFSQPFQRSNTVGTLLAASYAVRKNLVLDWGFNRGLTGTSTRWEVFTGFTYLLPRRIWTDHRRSRH